MGIDAAVEPLISFTDAFPRETTSMASVHAPQPKVFSCPSSSARARPGGSAPRDPRGGDGGEVMVKINPQTGCAGGARSSDDWDEKIVSRAAAVGGADQSRSKLLMKLKVRLVLEAKSLFVRVLSHPDYFLLWARQLLNLSGSKGGF